MPAEGKRGCGYRKLGGLYIVADGSGMECCKMPILLHVCPTCNQGVKQSRGWQWIDPRPWIGAYGCKDASAAGFCPLSNPTLLGERVGLIWIGTQFYPTPMHFSVEAEKMGISRRIKAIPKGFEIGKTWVFFAHPHIKRDRESGEWTGGVFRVARPHRIEQIVTDLDAQDEAKMATLRDKGITPFVVPHDDPAHRGSVYDKEEEFV